MSLSQLACASPLILRLLMAFLPELTPRAFLPRLLMPRSACLHCLQPDPSALLCTILLLTPSTHWISHFTAYLPCRPRLPLAFLPTVGPRAFLPRLVFFQGSAVMPLPFLRAMYRVSTHTSALLASCVKASRASCRASAAPGVLAKVSLPVLLALSLLSSGSLLPSAHLAIDLSLHNLLVVQTALFLAYLPREGVPRAFLPWERSCSWHGHSCRRLS